MGQHTIEPAIVFGGERVGNEENYSSNQKVDTLDR